MGLTPRADRAPAQNTTPPDDSHPLLIGAYGRSAFQPSTTRWGAKWGANAGPSRALILAGLSTRAEARPGLDIQISYLLTAPRPAPYLESEGRIRRA